MTQGFFTKKQLSKAKAKIAGDPKCMGCGLMKGCNNPQMEPSGRGKEKILIIGESSTASDDRQGKQFTGETGTRLEKELRKHDIEMRKDCWLINAVGCKTEYETDKVTGKRGLREPLANEIDSCRPLVFSTIEALEPEKIIILGPKALDSFLVHRWGEKLGGINVWRGYAIPDREVRSYVYPIYHPSYVMKLERKTIIQTTFSKDIKRAVEHEPETIDWNEDFDSQVKILMNPEDIISVIEKIIEADELTAFDYEATGLKPYLEDHKIWSASLSCDAVGTFSFHFLPEIVPMFKKFLASGVPKTAHNIEFEQLWSFIKLGQWVNNIVHCTQLGSHVLDNRRKTKSLKFQAYVRFGVSNWANEIGVKKFLKGKGKDKNSFNDIHKAPQKDLLLYGGLDPLHQLKLAKIQMREIYGN